MTATNDHWEEPVLPSVRFHCVYVPNSKLRAHLHGYPHGIAHNRILWDAAMDALVA